MAKRNGSFVLLLVYVDDDWMDIGGNSYPKEGYIEARKFTNDIDIRLGLYGILWGDIKKLEYEKTNAGYWLVVKAEWSDDLIKTDYFANRYKFRNGIVVFCGSLKSSRNYIRKHENDEGYITRLN